jgi:hypothetical protein
VYSVHIAKRPHTHAAAILKHCATVPRCCEHAQQSSTGGILRSTAEDCWQVYPRTEYSSYSLYACTSGTDQLSAPRYASRPPALPMGTVAFGDGDLWQGKRGYRARVQMKCRLFLSFFCLISPFHQDRLASLLHLARLLEKWIFPKPKMEKSTRQM